MKAFNAANSPPAAPGMFTAGHYVAWNNTALPPNPLDWAFFPLNRDGDNYVADVCAEVDPP